MRINKYTSRDDRELQIVGKILARGDRTVILPSETITSKKLRGANLIIQELANLHKRAFTIL